VWVAEVVLQQTRVAQAIPIFERFVRRFPTVQALAQASEEDVLKGWQGAGYYARARHLREAARELVRERDGRFPTDVAGWEALPGVGPYIARALASLLDGVPVVALEANGLRVAARWTRDDGDLTERGVRERLSAVLEAFLPANAPGEFNEAIMELGETICRPGVPSCPECPVRPGCRAFAELPDPGALPAPRRIGRRPHVRAAVTVLERDGRWLVQRRPPGGLLGGLWEFPGGKIEPGERPIDAAARELQEETGLPAPALVPVGRVEHAYSHFTVTLHVFRGSLTTIPEAWVAAPRRWVTPRELARLPLPKATEKILERLAPKDTVSRGSGSHPGRTPIGSLGEAAPRPVRSPPRGTGASTARSRARR
jgi:A/G-specific adenine glycosylase